MPTECSAGSVGFAPVAGRAVVATFDGGAITSDAGGLLLRSTDHAIGLVERLAACFADRRRPALIEHAVSTLVGQRVFGLALGYEDLNDHDDLGEEIRRWATAHASDGTSQTTKRARRSKAVLAP